MKNKTQKQTQERAPVEGEKPLHLEGGRENDGKTNTSRN